ncbi:hypothetical protein MNV_1110012 [Candidatus Methanoperedens nitroreducens]|uniref:Uncharacterized protein n=1 Tax=Candidatus Methanoperedens nitratireducens TaxID=1392998 RepID=A0A284VJ21_9EURY|nr:hypothetical protein MNV_1110012 [Candidatus Methanoperedens nitroreducens]
MNTYKGLYVLNTFDVQNTAKTLNTLNVYNVVETLDAKKKNC